MRKRSNPYETTFSINWTCHQNSQRPSSVVPCVYPSRVADAARALKGTGIPVASVVRIHHLLTQSHHSLTLKHRQATGFPSGQIRHEHKLEEIRHAVADGATEIDIVINRNAALCGDWETVYNECVDFREACGDAHMKAILAVGEPQV